MNRVYNFSAGPATLPLPALQKAQSEFLDYRGCGMSVLEMSHRGKPYMAIQQEARDNLGELLNLPESHDILFLQGGASFQFAMVPLNFLPSDGMADYVVSGSWAAKAAGEAARVGRVNKAADTSAEQPARMPCPGELVLRNDAAYLHITSNETIAGTLWPSFPDSKTPLVADMSSDILSRPLDVSRFDLIYAGAQKNLGPAGVTVVIIRKEWAAAGNQDLPAILSYQKHMEADSMFNTPPCFAIYMLMEVTRWLKKEGLDNIYNRNLEKAGLLYQAIDKSDLYRPVALPEHRSLMNITFRLADEELEARFISEAEESGFSGLKGHRSVGGLRASIYNAFPIEGVAELVSFMKNFEKRTGYRA